MKSFILGALLVLSKLLVYADTAESVVTTLDSLSANGVTFHRFRHDTPGASVEIDISVQSDGRLGHFESYECIVSKEEVSAEQLKEVDTASEGGPGVMRRTKSLKPHSVFLVLGKEISKSYFALEFSNRDNTGNQRLRRFLLLVSAVKGAKVVQTPESESDPER